MSAPLLTLASATWVEVRTFLAAQPDAVALLPVGALEAHGPHLPLATDVIIAEATARRAAAALGRAAALAPPLVYSVTRYAGGFAGTVSLDEDAARAHARAVCAGLQGAGFGRICLVNAHLEPAHVAVLRDAIAGLPAVLADPTERRFARTLTEEFKRGACHAGSYETSLVLAERPELVRDLRAGLTPRPIDLAAAMRAGKKTFVEAGAEEAYFGDPAAASAEEGEWIYARLVEMVLAGDRRGLAVSAQALLERFPSLVERLPHERLVSGPTPVEAVSALGEGVWVKRDDLTATPYGGNKVRKLELLLAEARRRGRRSVLTLGGTGSNHVLATAVYARALGFAATHAVLFPQPASDEVSRRLSAFGELGVAVARVPGKALVPLALAGRALASLARGQGRPFLLGPGGSSPLGALGYAGAALELAAQIAAGVCPEPSTIFVPLGSGGTAAGLLLGLRLAGLSSRLVAVQVVPRPWASASQVARLATRAAALLARLGADLPAAARRFDAGDLDAPSDQLGAGYGASTPAAEEAQARAGGAGLRLETTYSAKTLAALLARGRDGPSLFWLTYAAWSRP